MRRLIDSFLEFHNYIIEDCKTSKTAFFSYYILKPITFLLMLIVWIILLVE